MNKIPVNSWVRCKTNDELRYVTRHTGRDHFEDDGKVSGQAPSPFCRFEYYEEVKDILHKDNHNTKK